MASHCSWCFPLLLAAGKGPASLVITELTSVPCSIIPLIKVSAINSSEPSLALFVSLQASWKCNFFPCVIFRLFSALGLYSEETSPGGLFWVTRSKTVFYNLYPGGIPPPSFSAGRISSDFAIGTCIYSGSMTDSVAGVVSGNAWSELSWALLPADGKAASSTLPAASQAHVLFPSILPPKFPLGIMPRQLSLE